MKGWARTPSLTIRNEHPPTISAVKLLFSEAAPDYAHYLFPYVIWAFPEKGETPADILAAGFLPSSRQLDRFYLCRQVRVQLARFAPSSENRRILRGGGNLAATLVPRTDFDFTPARRDFCRSYTEAKFGDGGMSPERLDSLFTSPITTHVLVFTGGDGSEAGLATLYVEGDRLAFYSYAFYDLAHPYRSLGLFMMTTAVSLFAARGLAQLHLGSCYSSGALYKTQFAGFEFYNGHRWSADREELKFILQRQEQGAPMQHLLECEDYLVRFQSAGLPAAATHSGFTRTVPE